MKNVKLYIMVLIGILLMISSIMSGCSQSTEEKVPVKVTDQPAGPVNGGILRIMTGRTPGSPFGIPSGMTGFTELFAAPALEALWRIDENGKIQPILATAWDINPQGLSITITLRRGIAFHDGSPWNAEAAKYTFDDYKKAKDIRVNPIKSVDVVDDNTIRLNLSAYTTDIAWNIADLFFISPTAVAKNGKDWANWHPVGTGSFIFKGYQPDVSVDYAKNDSYWGTKSHIDGIKFMFVVDLTTQTLAIQRGEAQVLISADPKQISDLRAAGYNMITTPSSLLALQPDSINPDSIFANRNVRMAIDYAIDREQMCKAFGYGIINPTYQIATVGAQGYLPDLELRKYNPEKAKQLMATTSYPAEKLKTQIIANNGIDQVWLVAYQNALKSIGINAELNIMTQAKWMDMRYKGWTGLMYCTMGMVGGECINNWQKHYMPGATLTPSIKKPEGFVELLEKASRETDPAAQKKMAQQLVKIAYDDAMIIPVIDNGQTIVMKKGVHDLNMWRNGYAPYWFGDVWIEKDAQ